MTMGPFTIAKQSHNKFQVSDRWNDHVAVVDSQEHGEEWIKMYYQTLELEEQFLCTNSRGLSLALEQRNRNARARTAKATDKRRKGVNKTTIKYVPLTLSCGATIRLPALAA